MASKDGLDDLMRAFDRVKAAPVKVLRTMEREAEKVVAAQRHVAPKDTGALAESIVVTRPGEMTPPYSQPGGNRVAGPLEVIITAGNSDVRYAHNVENGTSKTEAHPFFWWIFRLLRKQAQQNIDRAGRKAVRDAWNDK